MGLSGGKEEKIPIRAHQLERKYPFLHNGAAPLGVSGFALNPRQQPCSHPAPDTGSGSPLITDLISLLPSLPPFLKVMSLLPFPAPR